MNLWRIGNITFPTLAAAVLHAAHHHAQITRGGKPVAWTAERKDNFAFVTARWAR